MPKSKKLIYAPILCLFLTLFIVLPTHAEDGVQSKPLTVPVLSIPIPTLPAFSADLANNNGTVSIPWIAEYVIGIYKYMIILGAIIAVVTFMAGGIMYVTAGGMPGNINKANSAMIGAVSGLVVLLCSYLLLKMINPSLTQLPTVDLPTITEVIMPDYIPEDLSDSAGIGAAPGDMVSITGANMKNTRGKAQAQLVNVFQAAAMAIEPQGCKIIAASAGRPSTAQVTLAKKYCNWSDQYSTYINCKPSIGMWGSPNSSPTGGQNGTCKYANGDTPIPHTEPNGKIHCDINGWVHFAAIDAFTKSTNIKDTASNIALAKSDCQQALIKAMTSHGACVLIGSGNPNSASFEPWHFEMGSSGSCRGADAIDILSRL